MRETDEARPQAGGGGVTDLVTVEPAGLLNVESGELLEPTIPNLAAVLIAARNMKERVNDIVTEATAYAVAEAERRGTKTLPVDEKLQVVVSGGASEEYDAQDLMELLRSVDCPEDRIEAAVVPEITWKINRSVLRQLAAANKQYAAAIDLAKREVEKPLRAYAKRRQ